MRLKHFECCLTDLDVAPLAAALEANPDLWDQVTDRQDAPGSAHHDTRAVILLGPASLDLHSVFHDLAVQPYPPVEVLGPLVHDLIAPLCDEVYLQDIGRVMLVELKPGGVVDAHWDEGPYAAHYQRFHIVITSEPGNVFHCGGEAVWMQPGQAWWFDHRATHLVRNESQAPRIHLIVDAVSGRYLDQVTPRPHRIGQA
jgi:hypothetical protein